MTVDKKSLCGFTVSKCYLHLWGQILFSSDTDKLWNQLFMNLSNYEFAKTPSKYLHRVPVVTGIFFPEYHDYTILNAIVRFCFVLLLAFGFCCGCCSFVSLFFLRQGLTCTPYWPRTHYVAHVGFNQTWNSPSYLSLRWCEALCPAWMLLWQERSQFITNIPSHNINMSHSALTWSDTWIGCTFKML